VHNLLNVFAAKLKLLPENLAIRNIVLLEEQRITGGRFSNVYHGLYEDTSGEQVEVALKVLRIFGNQSEGERHLLQDRFTKEALVWHYLKHRNILPFLGIDSTTFLSLVMTMALVSPWMAQGSVVSYIMANSPVNPYATELVRLSCCLEEARNN
jgi:hypothetical protein